MTSDKKDDDTMIQPFKGQLDKGVVLQETRMFSETPLRTRECYNLLTKILYLLSKGDQLNTKEATDVFFAVTKLFQSNDVPLRRMTYLVLKELTALAQDVIIAISILIKDMSSNQEIFKANAIRVLCRITDTSMLTQIERYVKTAIVDKDPYVSSCALVSSIHLSHSSIEVVRRWNEEVTDALNSRPNLVQYHALGLLYKMKQHDRLALSKFVTSLARDHATVRSPFAHMLLIRFVMQVQQDNRQRDPVLHDYLNICLRNKYEMVALEAARAICTLKTSDPKEIGATVSILQLMLSSHKPAVRFAAVKTLSAIAGQFPAVISNACSYDLENLLGDTNRAIATFAIITLLKVEPDTAIERLLKQIGTQMNDLSDEFKIVIVDAVRNLCLKYKSKYQSIMQFLAQLLLQKGGYQFRRTVVDTFLTLINEIPESKDSALAHLCEFIEDCEFSTLAAEILDLLGREGPKTATPSRYIRYIYNRIILENPLVRAAAIQALAKFGTLVPSLRENVVTLLKRAVHDEDDEVRDRAVFYTTLLSSEVNVPLLRELLISQLDVPLTNLEKALANYLANGKFEQPFDIDSVPKHEVIEPKKEKKEMKVENVAQKQQQIIQQQTAVASESETSSQLEFQRKISTFQQQFKIGELFASSKAVELTEAEAEYVVTCVKHIFPQHILFQFNCRNTVNDQLLENVVVEMQPIDNTNNDFVVESVTPAINIKYNETKSIFVLMKRQPKSVQSQVEQSNEEPKKSDVREWSPPPTNTFHNILKFSWHEVDSVTGEADVVANSDQYELEDIEVNLADYMRGTNVTNFEESWEQLGSENEAVETFNLASAKSLQDAVDEIINFFGMSPLDKTETVPQKRTKHILYLSGTFVGGERVLARVRMKGTPNGVGVELTVRSASRHLSQYLTTAMFS
jgi:coatomer protein complex subunit gamma